MTPIVTTQWLADELGPDGLADDLIVLDASSHLPNAGRDAKEDFAAGHIPGARYLDLASFIDAQSDVPGAIPCAEGFAERMSQLGVRNSDRVVIYDASMIKTSARAWFICRCNGMENVAILDGGFGKWCAENRPVVNTGKSFSASQYVANGRAGNVRFKADMLANCSSNAEQVADGRAAGHFTGEDADFNPDCASGHIPGARNVFFAHMFNEDGTYKDEAGIRAAFAKCGVDLDKPVVTSCGGGVVAAVLLFALELIGKRDIALYDGSWSEWGADPELPKATGPQ